MIFDNSVICPICIGRENDLQLLDRLMMQSKGGNGQIALISGEAGIGKSRLVREAKIRAPQGTVILEGYCFQTESALPYAPLLDLFKNFFAIHSSEEIAHAMEASAPQLVKLFPELTVYLPHLSSAPSPDPKQEKRHLFQALEQTITELAQNQPLILVIEDLHWSDSTSLEFLLLLARHISAESILLLLTYRSDERTLELTHFLAELNRGRLGVEFALKHMSPAEELPYDDASFDVVVSLVGAMFAPRPERVAEELVRVCRPGGRIIMVNWTPSSFVGQMFKAIARHVPPPQGVPSAMLWGHEATVRERLRVGLRALTMTHRTYPAWNYPFGVPQVVEFFRQNYGPVRRAFAALDGEGQKALRKDLEQVFSEYNRATDGTTSLESEFLEVDAIRNAWPNTLHL